MDKCLACSDSLVVVKGGQGAIFMNFIHDSICFNPPMGLALSQDAYGAHTVRNCDVFT